MSSPPTYYTTPSTPTSSINSPKNQPNGLLQIGTPQRQNSTEHGHFVGPSNQTPSQPNSRVAHQQQPQPVQPLADDANSVVQAEESLKTLILKLIGQFEHYGLGSAHLPRFEAAITRAVTFLDVIEVIKDMVDVLFAHVNAVTQSGVGSIARKDESRDAMSAHDSVIRSLGGGSLMPDYSGLQSRIQELEGQKKEQLKEIIWHERERTRLEMKVKELMWEVEELKSNQQESYPRKTFPEAETEYQPSNARENPTGGSSKFFSRYEKPSKQSVSPRSDIRSNESPDLGSFQSKNIKMRRTCSRGEETEGDQSKAKVRKNLKDIIKGSKRPESSGLLGTKQTLTQSSSQKKVSLHPSFVQEQLQGVQLNLSSKFGSTVHNRTKSAKERLALRLAAGESRMQTLGSKTSHSKFVSYPTQPNEDTMPLQEPKPIRRGLPKAKSPPRSKPCPNLLLSPDPSRTAAPKYNHSTLLETFGSPAARKKHSKLAELLLSQSGVSAQRPKQQRQAGATNTSSDKTVNWPQTGGLSVGLSPRGSNKPGSRSSRRVAGNVSPRGMAPWGSGGIFGGEATGIPVPMLNLGGNLDHSSGLSSPKLMNVTTINNILAQNLVNKQQSNTFQVFNLGSKKGYTTNLDAGTGEVYISNEPALGISQSRKSLKKPKNLPAAHPLLN